MSAGAIDLLGLITAGEIKEVEVAWADHQGYPRGKRIPAAIFVARLEKGIAFSDAALSWDYEGDVLDGCKLTGWFSGWRPPKPRTAPPASWSTVPGSHPS